MEALRAALVGRDAIERDLGASGMATVYLAEDVRARMTSALFTIGWLTAALPLAAQRPPAPRLSTLSTEIEGVVRRVQPAVVQIVVTAVGFDGRGRGNVLGEERRSGSGVVLSADGFLITNAHVVDGARQVQVLLAEPVARDAPGRSIVRPEGRRLAAAIVGMDQETDLAVLKVAAEGLAHATFGDSDSLAPGHFVLALGSPLGLSQSVSLGVVSAVGRQLEDDAPVVYIQTDAAVNPGASGGPLVDLDGRVVGINTMILSRSGGNEGIGLAVPSNIARTVFEQIRAGGRVRRGVIGVEAQTITTSLAAGLRLTQDWGVVLSDVQPRSPAAAAGLQVGDIVLRLNGKLMENARQFDVNLYQVAPGGTASLEIKRGLEHLSVQVRVALRDDDVARFADLVTRERNLVAPLGVLVVPVAGDVLSLVPWVRRAGGLLVAAWDAAGAGSDIGLMPGDVIYALNGATVATPADLSRQLGLVQPGGPVVAQVDRRGRMRFVTFPRP